MEYENGQDPAAQAAPAGTPSPNTAPPGAPAANSDIRSEVVAAKQRLFGNNAKTPDQGKAVDGKTEASPAPADPASTQAPAKDAKPEGLQADQAAKPTRNPKDAQSIRKLVAQKHQLKSQVDGLRAEIAELKKLRGEAPKSDDFESTEDFQAAKIEHNIELKNATRNVEARQQELQQQQHVEWSQRCQDTVKDFEAFAPRYEHYIPQIQKHEPEILEVVSQSAIGPRLLEEVFTDLFEKDENYDAWRAMSQYAKRNLLAQVEAKILREEFSGAPAAPAAVAQPTKSKAPAPVNPEVMQGNGRMAPPASMRDAVEAAKRRMFGG